MSKVMILSEDGKVEDFESYVLVGFKEKEDGTMTSECFANGIRMIESVIAINHISGMVLEEEEVLTNE